MKLCVASYAFFGWYIVHEMQALGVPLTYVTNLPPWFWGDINRSRLNFSAGSCALHYLANVSQFSRESRLPQLSVRYFDNFLGKCINDVDLLHVFSSFGSKSVLKAKSLGSKIVIERGSSHILEQRRILEFEFDRFGVKFPGVENWIIERELQDYENADVLIVQSQFAKETFLARGVSSDKLVSVPLPFNASEFNCDLIHDDSFINGATEFSVLYSGAISIRKGSHIFVEVAKKFANDRDIKFHLSGFLTPELQQLVYEKSDFVRFLGPTDREQLPRLFSAASVFLLPTVEDGFARVILEVMAMGTPVICTRNCGGADFIESGKDGFVVDIGDVDSIETIIRTLHRDRDYLRYVSDNARQTAINFGSDRDHGERLLKVYESLLHI